jgi:signal transduction histidine kinase
MKAQGFSNRIAIYFMGATAILILVIFSSIYIVVHQTVYRHLDDNLEAEYNEVYNGIVQFSDQIVFANEAEWTEQEHGQIEVNPTFIQVSDTLGNVIKKTPNLLDKSLTFINSKKPRIVQNSRLSSKSVRQLQVVLKNAQGQKAGYISVALPLEGSLIVLKNLLSVLLIAFPLILIVLYYVTRFITTKSIKPVRVLTKSAEEITRMNLDKRIALPVKKDELYLLTDTINNLLDRIEDTLLREKHFTSNASHELRTPLTSLKGTLELMIRKPHDSAYYVTKASVCLEEVNRMSVMIEQLLLLSRYENTNSNFKLTDVGLEKIIHKVIARYANILEQKDILLELSVDPDLQIKTNDFLFEQIIDNIFSNAIKYNNLNSKIEIHSFEKEGEITLSITDEGVGMDANILSKIFDRFYRADESRSSQIKGYGLGLSLAKKFADLLAIKIEVESQPEKGTTFALILYG